MSEQDRRRAQRLRKLMRLGFDYAGKSVKCVATDLNHLGIFVNSQVVPPIGFRLDLVYEDQNGHTITLRSRVVRVVHQTLRASRIPGMAVAFEAIQSSAGVEHLKQFVSAELGADKGSFDTRHFSTDSSGRATLAIPDSELSAIGGHHVHEERLRDGRMLPSENDASDDLLRRFTRANERRRNPRFPVHVELSFYVGDIPYLGSVLNISQSSLFMQTDHEIPPVGTSVSLKYPLAEAPDPQYVRIDGTVCRHWNADTEALPGYAVHFDHVGELGRRGIFQMYLNNFRKRASSASRPRRGFHYSMRIR